MQLYKSIINLKMLSIKMANRVDHFKNNMKNNNNNIGTPPALIAYFTPIEWMNEC